uniref:G_PROTEIN_RECEP_F1_2 domain-containing protein n=1 Tax=Steinernema glaseri TaxID=37863 RepID=A0A1I7ZMC5_9BILA
MVDFCVNHVTVSARTYYRRQQMIMKNLSYMILFFFFSWFIAHSSVLIVTFFNFQGTTMLHIAQSTAVIPAMLCYCQNYYIYFWRSNIYRPIFRRQISILLSCTTRPSQVYSTDVTTGGSRLQSRNYLVTRGSECGTAKALAVCVNGRNRHSKRCPMDRPYGIEIEDEIRSALSSEKSC